MKNKLIMCALFGVSVVHTDAKLRYNDHPSQQQFTFGGKAVSDKELLKRYSPEDLKYVQNRDRKHTITPRPSRILEERRECIEERRECMNYSKIPTLSELAYAYKTTRYLKDLDKEEEERRKCMNKIPTLSEFANEYKITRYLKDLDKEEEERLKRMNEIPTLSELANEYKITRQFKDRAKQENENIAEKEDTNVADMNASYFGTLKSSVSRLKSNQSASYAKAALFGTRVPLVAGSVVPAVATAGLSAPVVVGATSIIVAGTAAAYAYNKYYANETDAASENNVPAQKGDEFVGLITNKVQHSAINKAPSLSWLSPETVLSPETGS